MTALIISTEQSRFFYIWRLWMIWVKNTGICTGTASISSENTGTGRKTHTCTALVIVLLLFAINAAANYDSCLH
jgi:hypothetical protein